MKSTIRLAYSNDMDKCGLTALNQLLNVYGISFVEDEKTYTTKSGNTNKQKLLHINVDEEILHQYKKCSGKKAGRPTLDIDYDRIVECKRQGMDVNAICKCIGISRALYYRNVVSSINSLDVGTKITYRPIDEETWFNGTIEANERGGKYIRCDDGIIDNPRPNDVIRKL